VPPLYNQAPALAVVVRGNHEVLTNLNLVRVIQLIAVRIKDPHVLIGIAVELFTDLRKVVAALDLVGLARTLTSARGCAHGSNRPRGRRLYHLRSD